MSKTDFANWQGRHMMQCWSSQAEYAPIPVERAEGCWIHTTDGRRIFDLRSAHECINLGFKHPRIVDALKDQLEKVIYVTDDFATEPTGKLAKRLAELTPGSSSKRVYFAQSGAGAVEAAIKGARLYQYNRMFHEGGLKASDAPGQYPYPYKIISRYKSWHGSTAGAASLSGDPRRWFQEPLTVPGVVFAPEANAFRPPFGGPDTFVEENLNYLEYLIENEGGNNKVAAVIVEPVVGSNGIIPAPPGYLAGVRAICDRWDLLMIIDETMTGMGRTGKLLAIEHSGVEPDIIILGKALGAYCPLTAAIFSEKVSASFEKNIFGHGQSYSGHALGCAGALAALDFLLEDQFLETVQSKGQYLESKLRCLADKHPCVGDVRGMGLFYTMELVSDRASNTPLRKTTEKYTSTIIREVSEFLFKEKDVYVPTDKFGIWVVPPLIVSESEMDWFTDAIDVALDFVDARLNQ
jgi:taurine---2-oxoglutarate transaminase